MRVVSTFGTEQLAVVYVAETDDGRQIEFVESLQPPHSREEKWVNIISTLFGCPSNCPMCDAGAEYKGKLSEEQLWFQLDTMVHTRYPDGVIPVRKWKVQFARMGEPAFNPAVLTVLWQLPNRYTAPGLLPCISTVAPQGCEPFFNELAAIRRELYPADFQLQFSVHSTDPVVRKRLIPIKIWSLEQIAGYGKRFHIPGGRKLSLNFALMENVPVDPNVIARYFNPEQFLIKLTPLNPTANAQRHGLVSRLISQEDECITLTEQFEQLGFEVLVSIGELEENQIGSNCGQYVNAVIANC